MTDLPPMWKYMTPEEKGAILLHEYEGREVQRYSQTLGKWVKKNEHLYVLNCRYRAKPESVRETVKMYGRCADTDLWLWTSTKYPKDTHILTYETDKDGEPVDGTFKVRRIGDEQN